MPNYYPQTDLSQQNYSWLIAKIKELEAMITGGGLKVVTLVAEMTDHAIIYIYEGSESGMNPHHWYYWDTLSSAWTDGGYWGGTEVTFPIAVNKGGTGATDASGARTNLGLGALAVENSPLAAAKGGTGNTSLQATRNAMGLGNTLSYLPIANGGTGQNTAAKARNALGLGNTTGALPVANGGTGSTTAAAALSALGAEPAISQLAITKGGTGATDAATARSNLGITPSNIGAEPAITTATATVDVTAGGQTYTGAITLTRWGKVVVFELAAGTTTAMTGLTGANDLIATLPAGWLPAEFRQFPILARDSGVWASANYLPGSLMLRINGNVELSCNTTTWNGNARYMWGAVVYTI